MAWLREQGYTVDKVEHRQAFTRKTLHDLFGFADILAIREGTRSVLAVQATTLDHLYDRLAKIKAEPRAQLWRDCGQRIAIVGWGKGFKGGRAVFVPTVLEMAMPPPGAPPGTLRDDFGLVAAL